MELITDTSSHLSIWAAVRRQKELIPGIPCESVVNVGCLEIKDQIIITKIDFIRVLTC